MIVIADKPDILPVLQSEGIELKQKGNNFWACCPFHSEKTPSFKVDTDRQTFYCFGCHEHGDSIAFIQKYKGMSFKSAVRYLGISTDRPSPEALRKDKREKTKRSLIKDFRHWETGYHNNLCTLYRCLQKAKIKVMTEANLDDLAEFYHLESIWLHQIDILEGKSDEDKFSLYLEVTRK
jgi:DNA primase